MLGLSLTLYGYTCYTILALSYSGILKLAELLSVLQATRLAVGNFFCFPKSGATAQVLVSSRLADLGLLSALHAH